MSVSHSHFYIGMTDFFLQHSYFVVIHHKMRSKGVPKSVS